MKRQAARKTTPQTPSGEQDSSSNQPDQRVVFLNAVMNMSWQLAIVVLLPVIGGYMLDQKFETQPFLTIAGFVLAIGGIVAVFRQVLVTFGSQDDNNNNDKGNAK